MKKVLFSVVLLSLSSVTMAGLSETCKSYFDKIDIIIKNMPEDAASKQQIDMMKQNLDAGKQQVAALPDKQQETACQQGLEALKQLESVYPQLKQ